MQIAPEDEHRGSDANRQRCYERCSHEVCRWPVFHQLGQEPLINTRLTTFNTFNAICRSVVDPKPVIIRWRVERFAIVVGNGATLRRRERVETERYCREKRFR